MHMLMLINPLLYGLSLVFQFILTAVLNLCSTCHLLVIKCLTHVGHDAPCMLPVFWPQSEQVERIREIWALLSCPVAAVQFQVFLLSFAICWVSPPARKWRRYLAEIAGTVAITVTPWELKAKSLEGADGVGGRPGHKPALHKQAGTHPNISALVPLHACCWHSCVRGKKKGGGINELTRTGTPTPPSRPQ